MENNTKDIATCTGKQDSVSTIDSSKFNSEQPNNNERKNDIFEAKAHANEDAGNDNEYDDDNEDEDEWNFLSLSVVYPE